ncbi:PAS domain S-box protein [Rapidithrix thailandica]|uniref:histidine kinase n=1 Tax=Rapidithrix thailandica TaxID=413964 RepID=A0AAW9S2V6_9BACT
MNYSSNIKFLEEEIEFLKQELATTKAKLEEKEFIFNAILEATLAGYWDWYIQENYEYLSPTFKKMFGYEDKELENSPEAWQRLIFPEDLERVFRIFQLHVNSKGEIPYANEVRFRHKNGSTVNVLSKGKVIEWDEQGNPLRMVGCHVDITELKNFHKKVNDTAERLERIVSGINAGIWEWDVQMGIFYASPNMYKLLELPTNLSPLDYSSFLSLIHPEDLPSFHQHLDNYSHHQTAFKIELRLNTKKQGYRWFEVTVNAKGKQAPQVITGSIIEIHERKELQQNSQEQQNILMAIFNAVPDPTLIVQQDGTILMASEQNLPVFGYSPEELTGKNVEILVPEQSRKTHIQHRKQYIANPHTRPMGAGKELFALHKDGKKIPVEISLSYTKLQGELVTIVSVRDISYRQEQQNMLTAIFNAVPDPTLIVQQDGTILMASEQNRTIFGYAPDDLTGKNVETLVPEQYRKMHIQHRTKYLENPHTRPMGAGLELFALHKDGRKIPVEISLSYTQLQGELVTIVSIRDISHRKQIEEAKERNKLRFKSVFNQSFQLVSILSPEGKILEVNQAALDFTGHTLGQLKNKHFWEIPIWVENGATKRLQNAIKKAAKDNIVRYNTKIINIKGEIITLDFSIKPVKNTKGQIVFLIPEGRDISEIVTTKKELEQKKFLLREAGRIARVGGWEYDFQNEQITWSEQAYEIHEVDQKFKPTPQNTMSFYPKETLPIIQDAVQEAVLNKKSWQVEIPYFTAKKKRIWVRSIGEPILNDKGEVTGMKGIVQDITEQYLQRKKMQENEERFTKAFHHAPIGIALVSPEGNWLKVNKALCQIVGYTEDELLTMDWPSLTHPDDLKQDMLLAEKLFNGEIDSYQLEKRYIHKNGTTIHILLIASIVIKEEGKPNYAIVQIADITRKKEFEIMQMRENISLLTKKNTQLANFAYIVSHNLRKYTGNMEVIVDFYRNAKDDKERELFFDKIETISHSLYETVEHLTKVVKIKTDTNIKKERVDLEKLFHKVKDILEGEIEQTQAQIHYDFGQYPTIEYPMAYMESILLNLLGNAIKYRSKDRIPQIQLKTKEINGKCKMTCSDNGKGIDLEKYGSKIFGMYKTFHNNSDARGIGLFLTKNQIEAMGGSIQVDSIVDQGTTFTILF